MNQTKAELMLAALNVISLNPEISAWLAENDPMALAQVRRAIREQTAHCATPHSGHCAHPIDASCHR